MENMERQSFEDKLKDAFKNAALDPSPQVWNSIELDIARAESDKLRRKMVFFKLLAAASVVFGLAVAGATVLYFNQISNIQDQLAYRNESTADPSVQSNRSNTADARDEKQDARVESESSVDANASGKHTLGNNESERTQLNSSEGANDVTSGEQAQGNQMDLSSKKRESKKGQTSDAIARLNNNGHPSQIDFNPDEQVEADGLPPAKDPGGIALAAQGSELDARQSSLIAVRQPKLVNVAPVKIKIPESQKPDEVAMMLAKLNDLEKSLQKDDKKKKSSDAEKLWTSIGVAAGAFTGGNASVSAASSSMSSMMANTSNNIADKEANAGGVSYSVGVNVGTRVATRWVLQGGLNYMTQSSDYTVENAFGSADLRTFTPASINGIDEIKRETEVADAKVVPTAPYDVNNNVQYLSVPVQAGYLVLNKRFGVQLNAGVSTDMFLKNEKTADADNLEKIDQGRADSPYKTFNFSGLMGAEFSYKLGSRYRVALNPGMRYPFSSIYKSDVGVKVMPLTYDVGLRFRYIFQ